MKRINKTLQLNVMLKVIFVITVGLVLSGCGTSLKTPSIAVNLPEKYNTPDGMVLAPDGNIYLNCLNYNNNVYPAKLLKIDPDDRIREVFTYAPHPETGKAAPLGIDIGPDGNFYVADNQGFYSTDYKSRLLRVNMKNGRAVGSEVLVTGFIMSNAIVCHGDSVYVTETSLDVAATPMPSGVYRFKFSEFKGKPIKLLPRRRDEHLVTSFLTFTDRGVGANGMAIDSDGTLYVCNFGEASLLKISLDDNGRVTSQKVIAQGQGMESTDGIKICPKTGEIYVADFDGNAVHKICPETGKVTTIAKNANNSGGVGGLLDRPSEVCIRGNRLYISNIDLPGDGNVYDKPHTISVIELDK
jgi:sugar lactone lactonase YvrE